MLDQASAHGGRGAAVPELLLRDGRPEDPVAWGERLSALGLTPRHLDLWAAGRSSVLLYDPVDGGVRGAGVARELAPGTFELVAVVLAPGLAEPAGLHGRVVRAVGDRVRRLGGERLVPSADLDLGEALLAALGFRDHGPGAGGHHLEL